MTALRRLRRARTLNRSEWRLLGEAAFLALVLECALTMMSFHRLLAVLSKLKLVLSPMKPETDEAGCAVAAQRVYRVLPFNHTCLRESLVLLALLYRRGVDAELCIGVKKSGIELAAHAWVNADALPQDCEANATYRLLSLPGY